MLPLLLGYLAGSVPFAFLLARRAGVDVRVAGSGSVGAASVLRTAGARRGAAEMALDVVKGAGAVWLAGAPAAVVCAAAGKGALISCRHRANLRRLCSGTERRMGTRR